MEKAADTLEHALRSARIDAIPSNVADEFVLPEYAGHSLVNVPATVARILGYGIEGIAPPLDPLYWQNRFGTVKHVVLILVDALGYLQLREMMARHPDGLWSRSARQGTLLPMTSLCPSTTAAALVTLGTGVAPITHGVLGYELWLREYGVLVDMLGLKPTYGAGGETLLDWGLVPEEFVPVPGIGTRMTTQGIRCTSHVRELYQDSSLTRMCYRGFSTVVGHSDLVNGLDLLWGDLRGAGDAASYHFFYWGALDKAIHTEGYESDAWRDEYLCIEQAVVSTLAEAAPPEDTLLILCADHGFVSTPIPDALVTDSPSAIYRACSVPYGGESRMAYLHAQGGACLASHDALADALGPNYALCESRALVEQGFFGTGEVYPESVNRLGDYVALARGNHYLDRLDKKHALRGRHGGLSHEEMLIPWLAVRLDQLVI